MGTYSPHLVSGVDFDPKYKCTVEDCLRRREQFGYCIMHYKRWRKHGDPLAPNPAIVHGMSDRDEFTIWRAMRQRCNNPRSDGYHRYGGRGINICERWDSFKNFLSDMGPRPSKSHSIDRIDNDGPYSPENCRWTDRKTQGRNTRSNNKFFFRGQQRTLSEISELSGINHITLRYRLVVAKWPVERATTEPPNPQRQRA